jgi:peptide/nickel transport system substrate-binding protein
VLGSLFALSLAVVACGSDKNTTSNPTTPAGGTSAEATPAPTSPGGTSAPAATSGGEPAQGAEITIALGSEPTSLDPYLVDDGAERAVNDNVYETLLTRNATGELQPGLATELPTQIDDLTWQFKLRDGVKFHDGWSS